jgi:hypothetical protein
LNVGFCCESRHFVESASVVVRRVGERRRRRVFLAERYCSRKNEEYEVVKLKDVRNRRMSCSKDELVDHYKLTC